MKIKRLIVFAALLLTFASGAWADPVPQAIWCSGNHTLYFTYAEPVTQGSSYGGQTVDRVYSGTSFDYGTWSNNDNIIGNCTTVVFESSFSSARPTKCNYWFLYFGALTDIQGIENLNTSEVTDMGSMFANCVGLTSLDLSHFNTAKVTAMDLMFKNCTGLTALDLSSFDTSLVETMSEMFSGCSALATLTVASGWSKIDSRSDRFKNCSPSTINLVMDNDKSSQSLFEEFSDLISGKPVNVTLRNRKLYRDERWNTLCLPFDASLTGDLANTTVKTLVSSAFDSATGILTLIFTENSLTSIEAGKPYIVKWNTPQATNITNPEFHGVTISNSLHPVATTTTGTAPEGTVVTFDGTFSPLFIEQEDKSLLYMGAANKLYYPSGKMTIGSCRAHFRLQGIEAGDLTGNAIVLNFDGENTTGIVEMSDGRRKMEDVWFTLDGRKLNGKPTAKGVYIYKGNKRVIK
jgi:surface protein